MPPTGETQPTPRVRTLRAKAALAVAGTVFGLVLAELLLRVLLPLSPITPHTDPQSGSGALLGRRNSVQDLQGGTATFDGNGFRVEGPSIGQGRQVLFVGDSFAAGNQVDDGQSMVAAAERSLRSRGLDVDALNAGSQGLGTSQQLELLHHLVETMSFDAVVLVIFANNDLHNNWEDGRYDIEDGQLVHIDPPRRPLRTRLRARLAEDELLGGLMVVRLFVGPLTEAPSPTADDFELERLLLLDFARTARAHGAAPVFALVGTEMDCVGDQWWKRYRDVFGPSSRTRVAQMVQDTDVPWVDLCTAANRAEHYNDHYTPAGNEAVGAAIAELLVPLLGGPAAPR